MVRLSNTFSLLPFNQGNMSGESEREVLNSRGWEVGMQWMLLRTDRMRWDKKQWGNRALRGTKKQGQVNEQNERLSFGESVLMSIPIEKLLFCWYTVWYLSTGTEIVMWSIHDFCSDENNYLFKEKKRRTGQLRSCPARDMRSNQYFHGLKTNNTYF